MRYMNVDKNKFNIKYLYCIILLDLKKQYELIIQISELFR